MSLPDRNAPWPTIVTYFKDRKADGENLGVMLKRASVYRKTGKVEAPKMNATAKNLKKSKGIGKRGKSMRKR